VTLKSMRDVVKNAHDAHTWLKDIPGEVKDVAVRDMVKAREAHFAKLRKMKSSARHDAEFKFRTKRDHQQSVEVRARDMTRKKGSFSILSLDKLVYADKTALPTVVKMSVRFVRDILGRYYVVIPQEVTKKSENQAHLGHTVALDPGVRTFQTTYDSLGLVTKWGGGDMREIYVMCRKADRLQASITKKIGSARRGAKRAWLRVLDAIKNKVKDIHRKSALWLCENYKVILIPVFETSKMVRKGKRKLNTQTARNMLTWSHYGFRQALKAKAELHPWVNVIECEEPYTSKTCGRCGEIDFELGGSKIFACKRCTYVADRDANGARNIMLRYLSLYCEVPG